MTRLMDTPPGTMFSFRDPGGRLYRLHGRFFRAVHSDAAATLREFQGSAAGARLIESGLVVGSRWLDPDEAAPLTAEEPLRALAESSGPVQLLEHDAVRFPTYPNEWPPEMLWEAGRLTLQMSFDLTREGWGLKDATPFNVLYRGSVDGPRPVFVDVLSFERRDPGDSTWLPYGQFVRTFLLPLLLNRRLGVGMPSIFLASREGIEPEAAYRMFGWGRRLSPAVLKLASIPTWLAEPSRKRSGLYAKSPTTAPDKALFVLERTLRDLEGSLDGVRPLRRDSVWTGYNEEHEAEYTQTKKRVVAEILDRERPESVLDVGCNTGLYSAMAAELGAEVVAIDGDPIVVGRLWEMARARALNILPIAANIAQPSPALGWRASETTALLDRLEGKFDCALMLAVLHHLLVTERVPMEEVLSLAASLTRRSLILEFVAPKDEHFRRLARGRDELHADLTRAAFEKCCGRYFVTAAVYPLKATRWLYVLGKRAAG